MGLILGFLTRYWQYVLIGALIVSALIYVGTLKAEVKHYKGKADAIQKSFEDYKATQESVHEALTQGAKEISQKYRDSLKEQQRLTEERGSLNEANIKLSKELHSLRLSNDAVRLFNSTTGASYPEQGKDSTPHSKQGNAGEAGTTQTVADLMIVVNYNNKNHLKCIAQVEQWQSFWTDYTKVVENATP